MLFASRGNAAGVGLLLGPRTDKSAENTVRNRFLLDMDISCTSIILFSNVVVYFLF
jgi:hypothetical protein